MESNRRDRPREMEPCGYNWRISRDITVQYSTWATARESVPRSNGCLKIDLSDAKSEGEKDGKIIGMEAKENRSPAGKSRGRKACVAKRDNASSASYPRRRSKWPRRAGMERGRSRAVPSREGSTLSPNTCRRNMDKNAEDDEGGGKPSSEVRRWPCRGYFSRSTQGGEGDEANQGPSQDGRAVLRAAGPSGLPEKGADDAGTACYALHR